jgi:Ca2+:H+ antiporter
VFKLPLSLGLGAAGITLLALTLVAGVLTLATGRTTVLQGVVHLVILAAYLVLVLVP